jgi:anti-sigma B factor antagonist
MDDGTINVERHNGVWLLTVRGEHDLATADELRKALARSFSGGSTVIVDLSPATFIDSTVLNALLHADKVATSHNEHSLALVAPSSEFPRRLLDLVGISEKVPTYETRAEALDALTQDEEYEATPAA